MATFQVTLTSADFSVDAKRIEHVGFPDRVNALDFAGAAYRTGMYSSADVTDEHGQLIFTGRRDQVVFA